MGNKVGYIIQLQDRFSRAAKKINAQMKGIDRNADKAAKTINKKLTKSFKGLGNTAKNALGAVIAAFSIREFISRGAAFQDSIADLASITGSAGEELQFLSNETLRLAKVAKISQVDVGNAFTAIASAKSELLEDPKGLSLVTEQVLLLANAAGISVPEAIQASVGALNQFGQGADQAARFVNIMAAGTKVGASRVRETSAALVDAGFASASAGLSFEQTNAAIQVLAKSELKGARAGVALRNILTIMGSVAKGKFDPSVIGINESLEKFSELNLTNNQLLKIFGRESKDAAGFLIQNVDLFKRWTKEITGTNEAQRQAALRLRTFSAKLRGLGVSINDKVIKTFERLEPVISKQVEQLGKFFDSIDEKRVDAFAESVTGLAKAILLLGKGAGVIAEFSTFAAEIAGTEAARVALAFTDPKLFRAAEQQIKDERELAALERSQGAPATGLSTAPTRSQIDFNLNLRAPERVIDSTKTRTSGKTSGLNVGVNMEAAI